MLKCLARFKVTLTQSWSLHFFHALLNVIRSSFISHRSSPPPSSRQLPFLLYQSQWGLLCKLFMSFCSDIPTVGPYIQKPFKIALEKQKEKLHRKPEPGTSTTSVSDTGGPAVKQSATNEIHELYDRHHQVSPYYLNSH